MSNRLREFLQYQFHHPNYLYFMVSLFLMIVLPPFAPLLGLGRVLLDVSFGIVIAMAVFYTTASFREFILDGILGFLLFFIYLFFDYSYINPFLMAIFFSLAFRNIIYHIFNVDRIGLNEVYASVAGYLILGIAAMPFFFLIEQSIPNSFSLPEDVQTYDFIYFSFITLTTIGFGDIVPIHPIAKAFTVLMGIFGQLYLTILIAIIIGKFLAHEMEERN